ncbi:hypothetical protein MNV49_007352 [Pseudohyphozyma bogoriensis]|nr:hypothetical protein MNV49_007352 [Pseudohyphozyma bogoriensis]
MVGTGGLGGAGTIANVTAVTPHADSLFTQDSVVVQGQSLYVVNSGSNTLSMFDIDPKCPTNLVLRSVVSSGGDFPTSVAVNAEGSLACVLNSGVRNGVACASVTEAGLAPLGDLLSTGLNQTTPPAGPAGTVSDLLFDSQDNLLVTVKGTGATDPGYLGVVSLENGIPTSIEKHAPNGGAVTFSITEVPESGDQGPVILTTDPAVTFVLGSNVTSTATAIPNNTALAIDSTGAGKVIAQTVFSNTTSPIDIRVAKLKSGANKLLINTAGDQSISVMTLVAGGKSYVSQTFDLNAAVKKYGGSALTTSVQGMHVYVASK